ncbi:MAG: PAS domain-containing protein [Halanaerobiales bacterium]|nr:PAS domain-containing protein [Halanaerobiales bacterium]
MNIKLNNLKDIVETVNAIIWEYDIENDNWEYVSPQVKDILGYEPEEWIGLDFWVNNIHEEDRTWAKEYCFECASKGQNHIFEYRFKKRMMGIFG